MDIKIIKGIENLKYDAKLFKDFANNSMQKLMTTDYAHMAVLGYHMGMFYYGMSYPVLLPLLTYYKPQMGMWSLLFLFWVYYDRNTPRMNGRKSKWYTNLKMFKLMRSYFPIRLIKTADLPEGRNYILAHYPHSVLPFSVISNFLTNCDKVADNFPGIEMHYLTLDSIFLIPFLREMALALGGHSCSESSFKYLLKSKPSKGIIVLPGGAAEIQYTRSDSIYIIIKRKGFVRLALTTGTPLVPVFTFGETNTWTKVIILPIWKRLKWIIKLLFNCSSGYVVSLGNGLLPNKIPVNTIVGAPIPVPKVENPPKELIDEYYEIFFQALQDLFEKYKEEYDIAGEKAKIIMLEK